MPDTIRAVSGGIRARTHECGFLERDDFSSNRHRALAYCWSMIFSRKPVPTFRDHAVAASCMAMLSGPAQAKDWTVSVVRPSLAALASLDTHQIVALTLTLGILCFAVVTAILLVRTRVGADHADADARGQIVALRTKLDRTSVLLLSE